MSKKIELLLGNEAVARGAYEAGVDLVSSYPGTPSTEITEYIAEYDEIFSEWAPNEKVSLEVALGASIAGGRAMCAMKHVGLNVAADPLFTASYTGVNGGLVICVADDPGMHSSQNEQDSRNYARASNTPMLEPADSEECYSFTKKAFELSEEYDTPVLLRLTTRISHSRSPVESVETEVIKENETCAGTDNLRNNSCVRLKEYKKDPAKYVMMPSMARARHKFVCERGERLTKLAEETKLNQVEYHDKKIGVIASGIAYQTAKEALGDKASYLKLGMVFPMPTELILSFAAEVETCYVIEELDPFIEDHCKKIGVRVIGKEIFSLMGEYSTDMIRKAILNEAAEFYQPAEGIPARPPVMCAGCPHRSVFYALNRLGLTVCGDIGCYTLGALPPLSAMDTCVCMGASIGMAHGMNIINRKKTENSNSKNSVAVIGDSTFIHSGITGLIDIVYNFSASTVIILDNSITGMTGHQQNPSTGLTIKNRPAKALDLEKLCLALGVERVKTVDPFDMDLLIKTIKEETSTDEPSVIIAKRPCALLKTTKHGPKNEINKEICRECGVCLKIGCPAIFKRDGKAYIDRSQCGGCDFCRNVCKTGAIASISQVLQEDKV